MKIIGFDQSSRITGVSVWDNNNLVEHFAFVLKDKNPVVRLREFFVKVNAILDKYNPDFVVLEGVYCNMNMAGYALLSNVQGILFAALFAKNIPFAVPEATVWRKSVGIVSKKREEQKSEAITLVRDKYGINVTDDEAEAILIGLYGTTITKEQ